jgi:hypothetical protein
MSIMGGAKAKAKLNKTRARGKVREALDHEWMRKHRQGKAAADIATAEGVSKRTVQLALARARAAEQAADTGCDDDEILPIRDDASVPAPRQPWWLELVPLFPIGAFTPTSKCPHHAPIRAGSLFCCMVCSTSGIDDHPALQLDPMTDPQPEPVPAASNAAPKSPTGSRSSSPLDPAAGRETRKERRRRQYRAVAGERGA